MRKNIPDDFIDLTVSSPPYSNFRNYHGFVFDYKTMFKELHRVTKPGGIVVWVIGDKTVRGSETGESFRQALFAKEIGFNLHDTMIYQKTSPYPANVRYQQDFEYMFVFSKGKCKTFNPLREMRAQGEVEKILKGQYRVESRTYRRKDGKTEGLDEKAIERLKKAGKDITKIKSNIWKINAGYMTSSKDKITFKHPASFPEQLAEDHILSWSNEGDIVLDPMAGSGTVAKMAWLNNRKFIGIDISEEYINNICVPRLEAYGWKKNNINNTEKKGSDAK